jgi:hypothetical protein
MSKYANKTAAEREALAADRNPGEEVPKCGFHFNHSKPTACDLFRSHDCGPSEIALAYAAMMTELKESRNA